MNAPTVIAASSGSGFLFIIIIAFLLLYLIVVRPQRRRQNQQQQMLSHLEVGDEVLTAGGIYGTVSSIHEDEVTVEIAPQLEVRVARRAIAGVAREPEPEESETPEEAGGEHEDADTSPAPEADSSGVTQGPETSGDENPG
jgi:preprotein translocase subunit YajC